MVAIPWRWKLDAVRRYCHDQRGGVLVFVAISIVPMLGMAGLALDLGRAYVVKAQLSRAVDAGSLAAGRALRQGRGLARQEAFAVAGANGVRDGYDGVMLSTEFGTNAEGEQTVALIPRKPMPTLIMRLLGRDVVDISSAAEAAVPPVDMVLVLDRSGSLATQNAWVPLQNAASQFVQMFDDHIDQLGLVSFQVRAQDEFLINGNFKLPVGSAISAMNSAGDTNTGEGLRYAYEQPQRPNVRPRSAKVVVFFTDGRPHGFPWQHRRQRPRHGGADDSDRLGARLFQQPRSAAHEPGRDAARLRAGGHVLRLQREHRARRGEAERRHGRGAAPCRRHLRVHDRAGQSRRLEPPARTRYDLPAAARQPERHRQREPAARSLVLRAQCSGPARSLPGRSAGPAGAPVALSIPGRGARPLRERVSPGLIPPDGHAAAISAAPPRGPAGGAGLRHLRARPARGRARAAIHGGSWRGRDRTQLPGLNRYLAGPGYVVAAIDYRLAPAHPHPAALEDIGRALH